jgi:signal peptidase I
MKSIVKRGIIFIVSLIILNLILNLLLAYAFPIKAVKLGSFSMSPAYNLGDILWYAKSDTYNLGDTITFNPQGSSNPSARNLMCHRIINITEENGKLYYSTKGDANSGQLPWEKSIPQENVIGKVVFSMNKYLFYALKYFILIVLAAIIAWLFTRKNK